MSLDISTLNILVTGVLSVQVWIVVQLFEIKSDIRVLKMKNKL